MIRYGLRGLVRASIILSWLLVLSHYLAINGTPSMPEGLWASYSAGYPITRGSAVVVCLPMHVAEFARGRSYIAHGSCAGDYEAVLKRVVATAGDIVQVSDDGIAVNGLLIPQTHLMSVDSRRRTLPGMSPGTYVVEPGTVWIVSNHDRRSYDSRYFGPVPLANVRSNAIPLLVIN